MKYVFSYQGTTNIPSASNVVLRIDKQIIGLNQDSYPVSSNGYPYLLIPEDGYYLLTLNVSHAIGGAGGTSYNGLSLRSIQNYTNQALSDGVGMVLRGQQAYGAMNIISGIFPFRKGTAVFAVAGKAPSTGPASALFSGGMVLGATVTVEQEAEAAQQ